MGIGNAFIARLRRAIAREQGRGIDVDPIKLAKELIRQERNRLRKAGGAGRGGAAEILNRERYARRKAQELASSLLGRRRNRPPPKDLLVAQFRESPLLDTILP